MSVIRIMVFHLFTKFEVSRHSRSEDMNIACDLSICKWGHLMGHPCHVFHSCQF